MEGSCIKTAPWWIRRDLRLGIGWMAVPPVDIWAALLPSSIYLGCITVPAVANVTSLFDYLNWRGSGIAPDIWMGMILVAVLAIAVLMNFTRRAVAYALVILWALAGFSFKYAAARTVDIPNWITFGGVGDHWGRCDHRPQC